MSQSLETSIIFLFSLVGFGLGDVREAFLPPPPLFHCLSTLVWAMGQGNGFSARFFLGGWVRGGNGALSLFSFGCFDRSLSKAGNLRSISCLVFWASAVKNVRIVWLQESKHCQNRKTETELLHTFCFTSQFSYLLCFFFEKKTSRFKNGEGETPDGGEEQIWFQKW